MYCSHLGYGGPPESSMQVAEVAEVWRTREREGEIQWIEEQNAQAVPPLSPESLEILYVSYLD